MNTISAPILDNLIAKAQSHPDLLNLVEKDTLLHIINKLRCVAVCGNDECRQLWLTAERGSIEDFGDYEEYLEFVFFFGKFQYIQIYIFGYFIF